MNIDDALNKTAGLTSVAAQQKRTDSTAARTAADAKAPANTGDADSVRLSPQYQTLAKAVNNSSSFNAEKVASIKEAIANGKFTIDAGKIADGVLATVTDLINSRRTS